jgi:cytochrome oxidase Cu insertion factor (SCO1/SenC/PrrC family)
VNALGLVLLLALGAAAPRFEPPAPGSYELPPLGSVAPHLLLGSDGAPAPLLAIGRGEAALVAFVYLDCPDACPLANAVLQRLDRSVAADPALAGRVELATVSLDPARDTPERMQALRRALAPRGRWRFLTAATPAEVDPVLADFGQDALRRAGPDGVPQVSGHTLKLFLVDGAGRIRNVYSSGFLDERILRNDLLSVVAE